MVIVVGTETSDGDWWTWWSDRLGDADEERPSSAGRSRVASPGASRSTGAEEPVTWFIPRATMDRLGRSLQAAVPGYGPDNRLQAGLLAQACEEWALVSRLARALLPEPLRRRLLDGEPLRLLPAPAAAAVPWELLPLGAEPDAPRLVERTTVSLVPPTVRRDVDPGVTATRWEECCELPPLYVVDPTTPAGSVLADPGPWQARAQTGPRGLGPGGAVAALIDRRWLSQALPGRSRLLYVGHVAQAGDDPASAGLALGCSTSLWSADPQPYRGRLLLTAADLVRGSRGATGARDEQLPEAAWGPDGLVEVDGSRLWPMPPRVGLVACRSGDDLSHPEPFGLVTAVIDAGAETVVATRWSLLSDTGYQLLGAGEAAFARLAEAVDEVLVAADPARALAQVQRDWLDRWRRTGALEHAPSGWAALTTYQAWQAPEEPEEVSR
ncbi:MAG: CHAT domain-containing protein [Actinomycetia bacterium]|nr:CHAT domain-containing protein [Actinomycetes bacterium]